MYEERIVAAAADPHLEAAAVASRNEGDFELPFKTRFRDIMVDRAEADTAFTQRFFTDNEFQGRLTREARRAAYRMIRRRHGLPDLASADVRAVWYTKMGSGLGKRSF
jgi:type I restriction enzyme R subunit